MIQQVRLVRRQKQRAGAKRMESRGRRVGAVIGSWVTDLAALQQSILLCGPCDAKWKHGAKKYGYEIHRQWMQKYGGVIGKCDGCREPGHGLRFYVHESLHGKV